MAAAPATIRATDPAGAVRAALEAA
jgi:hypothetical protein